jgi:hypothetical protein
MNEVNAEKRRSRNADLVLAVRIGSEAAACSRFALEPRSKWLKSPMRDP